jgi:hypothetical protein
VVYLTRLETFLLGCLDKTICNLSRSFNGVVLIYIDFVMFCVRAKYIRFWIPLKEKQTHTAWSDTIFFSYFLTYLWGISHRSFINYGSNATIYNFFQPETNRGEFRLYFELFVKSCKGRHQSSSQKYKKQTKKHVIFTMDSPLGVPGVSKNPKRPKK